MNKVDDKFEKFLMDKAKDEKSKLNCIIFKSNYDNIL